MIQKGLAGALILSWLMVLGCGVKGPPLPYITAETLAALEAREAKEAEAALATPTPAPAKKPTKGKKQR